jgi:hypothetical protein
MKRVTASEVVVSLDEHPDHLTVNQEARRTR